jgi:hypothetical protein
MRRWLIDDFGTLHRSGVEPLALSLGLPAATIAPDLQHYETYAIVNLGMIVLESATELITARCRPAVVSDRAVGTLSYWLLDHPGRSTRIVWHDSDWLEERARDGRAAIALLSYLLELKRVRPLAGANRICSQPSVRAARLWQGMKSQIAAVTARPLPRGAYAPVLDPVSSGRWTVVEVDATTGDVRVVDQGSGYPVLHPIFDATAAGRDLQSLADTQYRDWVSAAFVRVANSGQMSFDDVDAIIHWPRFGDLRTRYWRILVPLPGEHGRRRVLSISGNDSGIDLRPQNIQKAG